MDKKELKAELDALTLRAVAIGCKVLDKHVEHVEAHPLLHPFRFLRVMIWKRRLAKLEGMLCPVCEE